MIKKIDFDELEISAKDLEEGERMAGLLRENRRRKIIEIQDKLFETAKNHRMIKQIIQELGLNSGVCSPHGLLAEMKEDICALLGELRAVYTGPPGRIKEIEATEQDIHVHLDIDSKEIANADSTKHNSFRIGSVDKVEATRPVLQLCANRVEIRVVGGKLCVSLSSE